jgi:hypothetical protein
MVGRSNHGRAQGVYKGIAEAEKKGLFCSKKRPGPTSLILGRGLIVHRLRYWEDEGTLRCTDLTRLEKPGRL